MTLNRKQVAVLQAGVDLASDAQGLQEVADALEILTASALEMVVNLGGHVRGRLAAEARDFVAPRRARAEIGEMINQRQECESGQNGAQVEVVEASAASADHLAAIEAEDAAFNAEVAEREHERKVNGDDNDDGSHYILGGER